MSSESTSSTGGTTQNEIILEMKDILKVFGGVVANDHVSLSVRRGHIHALLGENGSGKSTLMKILYGLYGANGGEIFLRGEKVNIHSPNQAIEHGIYMIHQHFMLVPQMTVAENIVAGDLHNKTFINMKGMAKAAVAKAEEFGFSIDPNAFIHQLSVGERQKVEIIKALYRGAEILILDEPTAVLTPQETTELLQILRTFVEKGKTIIFITHKLEEVAKFSDMCTILRAGKVIDTVRTADTDKVSLACMMVGRDVVFRVEKDAVSLGAPVVEVKNISIESEPGRKALHEVSFEIREGEILGIAGVDGNGQIELSEALAGLLPLSEGSVCLQGADIAGHSVRDIIHKGVSFVPSERNNVGTIGNFPVLYNFVLRTFRDPPHSKHTFLNFSEMNEFGRQMVKDYEIKLPNLEIQGHYLSGGNLQKVILARELAQKPKLLICVYPTRGLDVGAIEYVQRCLLDARKNGTAILLISTELEEILTLSDRIAVMNSGRIMGIVPNDDTLNMDHIGMMIAGVDVNEQHA